MKAAMRVPERNVERWLKALRDGRNELCSCRRYYDKERNFGKQRELASFEPVIVAERQRDEPGQEGEAPHPRQRYAPFSADHPDPAQARAPDNSIRR